MEEPAKSPVVSKTMPSRNEFDEDSYVQLHPDVAVGALFGAPSLREDAVCANPTPDSQP
jgi:hypothetical protein